MKTAYWNALAEDFGEKVLEVTETDLSGVFARVAKQLGGRTKTAVDFGCGPGASTRAVAPYFKSVTGVDFSPALIGAAKDQKNPANTRFRVVDLSRKTTPRLPCDAGFCINVLISPNAALRETIARNVRRSVKRGGSAVFAAPSFESALRIYQVLFDCQIKSGVSQNKALAEINGWASEEILSVAEGIVDIGGEPTKTWRGEEFTEFLYAAGFRDIELQRIEYPWAEVLDNAPRRLSAAPPWDWMAVGRKP